MSKLPRAAYIHVPFCRKRCGYCNFTVVAGHSDLQLDYLAALDQELRMSGAPHEVDTIFVGGGTPTELTEPNLQQLCLLIKQWFPPASDYEWSWEANPDGLTCKKADLLATAGVNRISLGAQSFDARKLKRLERDHREQDITDAYRMCQERFRSVSLDLIFAAPGETIEQWRADVRHAVALAPQHLSIYGLTFEKGARFWGELARGMLSEIDQQRQREMYELAIDMLTQNGWDHYEVSNFARAGHRCRHNEIYWRGQHYFGVGPGASRYIDHRRETNHRSTFTYIRLIRSSQSPVAESESLSAEDRARERLVFQLRMIEGLSRDEFFSETGYRIDQLVAEPLSRFVELGLIEDNGSHIRLTRDGLLISDSLWPEFL